MTEGRTRSWINTVSLDRVQLGVEGGFTQADHGRDTRLRRLGRGDRIAFYSPRTAARTGRALQQFTALGVVVDDEPYRAALGEEDNGEDGGEVGGGPGSWRRRVEFEAVVAVPVRPLLAVLGFVEDEETWGLPFRRGLFEVTAGDLAAIAGAMRDASDPGTTVIGAGVRPTARRTARR